MSGFLIGLIVLILVLLLIFFFKERKNGYGKKIAPSRPEHKQEVPPVKVSERVISPVKEVAPQPRVSAVVEKPAESQPVIVKAPPVKEETKPVQPEEVEHIQPEDLTIIEGIGPKINKLLHESGIKTLSQLAKTSPEKLADILVHAKLRIADQTTWPEQAALAAAGKMDELQKLQDSLKGGRKK